MTNTTQTTEAQATATHVKALKLVERFVQNIDKRDAARFGSTAFDLHEGRAERAFDTLSALVGEDEAVSLIESARS